MSLYLSFSLEVKTMKVLFWVWDMENGEVIERWYDEVEDEDEAYENLLAYASDYGEILYEKENSVVTEGNYQIGFDILS